MKPLDYDTIAPAFDNRYPRTTSTVYATLDLDGRRSRCGGRGKARLQAAIGAK
jgi:hypothetical protein